MILVSGKNRTFVYDVQRKREYCVLGEKDRDDNQGLEYRFIKSQLPGKNILGASFRKVDVFYPYAYVTHASYGIFNLSKSRLENGRCPSEIVFSETDTRGIRNLLGISGTNRFFITEDSLRLLSIPQIRTQRSFFDLRWSYLDDLLRQPEYSADLKDVDYDYESGRLVWQMSRKKVRVYQIAVRKE